MPNKQQRMGPRHVIINQINTIHSTDERMRRAERKQQHRKKKWIYIQREKGMNRTMNKSLSWAREEAGRSKLKRAYARLFAFLRFIFIYLLLLLLLSFYLHRVGWMGKIAHALSSNIHILRKYSCEIQFKRFKFGRVRVRPNRSSAVLCCAVLCDTQKVTQTTFSEHWCAVLCAL